MSAMAHKETFMRHGTLFGLVAVAIGCAGMSQGARASNSMSQTWQGFMLRDGLRVPISLDLANGGADSTGQLRVGQSSFALEHLRVSGADVHFEVAGGSVFDGTLAGNAMAGSVSGSEAHGSFTLTREEPPLADPFYPSGP
jgi:hypothetical protein